MLYKVSREGELVGEWEQTGWITSNYGWRDLTEDGEYLYGVDSTYIAQISPETGQVTGVRYPSPLNPTYAVAYDAINGIFWVGGTTTNIIGVDREGNQMGVIYNRGRFRTSGLFFCEGDPDGCPLYILSTTRDADPVVLKVDPAITDNLVEVVYIPLVGEEKPGGCDVTFDMYPNTWTAVIQMQGPEDWMRTFEVYSDFPWVHITPVDAVVEGGNGLEFDLVLNSEGMAPEMSCTGHIMFDHNTIEEEPFWIDVTMNVVREESVVENPATPLSFGIESVYPNPFNPTATVDFNVDVASNIRLEIYDVSGRMITTLFTGQLAPGGYQVPITASDWAAGIYLVHLENGLRTDLRKITLIK